MTPIREVRGQTLVAVLVLISFLGLIAGALHTLMLESHAQIRQLQMGLGTHTLALSGLAAGGARLTEEIATDQDLQRQLNGITSSLQVPLDLTDDVGLLEADYPGATVAVTAEIGKARTLGGEDPADPDVIARHRGGRGWDPRELRWPVTLMVKARWGSQATELKVDREIAQVNLSPGTLGKFTLWAKTVEPTNADGLETDFDGAPRSGSSARPVVLHNAGTVPAISQGRDPESYKGRGYVYLGGGPKLKMTSGFLGLGELWSFLPIEDLSTLLANVAAGTGVGAVPAYQPENSPDYFLRDYPPPPVANAPVGPYRYELRTMVGGFYSGPDGRGRGMVEFFPREEAQTLGLSSRLHLYGSAADPSPTLVLGQVTRVTVELTGLLVDATGEGVADALVAVLPEVGPGRFPGSMPAISPRVPGFAEGNLPGASIPLDNDGELTWEAIFDGSRYEDFASRRMERPYMESYDFMYRDPADTSFQPAGPFSGRFVEEFDLKTPGGEAVFTGPAAGLAARDALEKVTFTVENATGLDGAFVSRPRPGAPGELALGAWVSVRKADSGRRLVVSDVTVTRGGALVLEGPGDIVLRDVRFESGLDYPLIVVAMAGDVILERPPVGGAPLPLVIVTPGGRLRTTTPDRPLTLEGGLVVQRLDLDAVTGGADVYHDRRLDPSDASYFDGERVLISDAPTRW